MEINIDLGRVARDLRLAEAGVQKTVDLLDEGNTVPFITRYRKDQTGGLDEEQIRTVQDRVAQLRQLAERKQTILKSIESQGALTPELADRIRSAQTAKRLEDIYLPYRPKKQTLATLARERGLETLANQIAAGDDSVNDLQAATEPFVNPENSLHNSEDVLVGVGHILAEQFSERIDVRSALREILRRTGVIAVSQANPAKPADAPTKEAEQEKKSPAAQEGEAPAEPQTETTDENAAEANAEGMAPTTREGEAPAEPQTETTDENAAEANAEGMAPTTREAEAPAEPQTETTNDVNAAPVNAEGNAPAAEADAPAEPQAETTNDETAAEANAEGMAPTTREGEAPAEPQTEATNDVNAAPVNAEGNAPAAAEADAPAEPQTETTDNKSSAAPAPAAAKKGGEGKGKPKSPTKSKSELKRQKKRQQLENAFKDYFDFREPLAKAPPHRILAINRGDRAKVLRVRVDVDLEQMIAKAIELAVPADHKHAEFLKNCMRDAVTRLVCPALTRDVRRELTEQAEQHAVQVFVRNLRKLLLQPPVRGRRVLAIDPGFRNGCKIAVLDEFGQVLDAAVILLVGKSQRTKAGRAKLVELANKHTVQLIAIGNGAGCRETEQIVSDLLAVEWKDKDLAYVIVNEAGTSVYSTSPTGREELPSYDPMQRSAISIGRRLLDPLSELVKINPANIGVGLYQHDIKAKHLRNSLDAVVESCVNYVGVNVNTASPALLRYVSGLNQLTARRLYEYRLEHGPFVNREQFKQVPGFGDATFVQAAGFLKIVSGDNPLDATAIHPESYDAARKVLGRLGGSIEELSQSIDRERPTAPSAEPPQASASEAPTETPTETPPATDAATPGDDDSNREGEATAEPQANASEAPTETPTETPPATDAATHGDEDSNREGEAPAEPQASASEAPTETPTETAPATDSATPGDDDSNREGEAPAEPQASASDAPAETPPATDAAAPSDEDSNREGEAPAEPQASASDAPAETAPATDAAAPSDHTSNREGEASAEPQASASDPPPEPTPSALQQRLQGVEISPLAEELEIGELLMSDIVTTLARPMRDPREDFPPPMFRRGVMKLEDLEPGIELEAVVLNVVDFGAFVDIGLTDSGLIHISRLADRYIKDPHEVVSVGDRLPVWVVEVDSKRRRVSLTAIRPGTEKPARARRGQRKKPRPADKPKDGQPRRERRPARKKPSGKTHQRRDRKPAKPKPPAPPITKAMEDGSEPMRSFSDLVQFYEKKTDEKKSDDDKQ